MFALSFHKGTNGFFLILNVQQKVIVLNTPKIRILLAAFFLCCGYLLPAQWVEVSPNTTEYFEVCEFVTPLHGFVGGTNGILFETWDAGENWRMITLDRQENLSALNFPTSSTGYVGGANGLLFKTTDRGQTWTELTLPYASLVEDIYFVTEDRGYLVMNDSPDAYLLKTINGGASWTEYVDEGFLVPSPYSADFRSFRSVSVVGGDQVYVGGYRYTYTDAEAGTFIAQIQHFDEGLGLLGTRYSGDGSDIISGIMDLETVDQDGLFAMQNTEDPGYPSNGGSFHAVRELAGNYFQGLGPIFDEEDTFYDLEVAPNQDLYLAGYNWGNSPGTHLVYRSTDSGLTFTDLGYPYSELIEGFDFPSEHVGYFAGTQGKVYRFGDLSNIGSNDGLTVYPNPCHTHFSIRLEDELPMGEYTLYDAKGRKVIHDQFSEDNDFQVDIDIPYGLYHLTLVLKDGTRLYRNVWVEELE